MQIFMNTLLLFFLISTVHSQNIINKLTVNTSIHIAMSKFATPLVVEVKIPKGETSVGLKVSFPEGISYSKIEIPQQEKTSVKIEKTTTSTANQPIFIITAAPESVVKILIHRNFNKQVKANVNYSDVVEAILGGKTVEKQTSEFYQLKFPKLTTAMDPIEVGSKGENRRGLTVKNLGEGYIKEFYLSIQYPDNIKNKALYYKKGLNYHLLTPETAVPKEFAKKGLYLYKINVKLLKKEEDAELSLAQEYEIDNCFSPTPIQYQVYWGSDFSTEGFFQVSEITKKIVSNYTVLNKLSYQKGKITGKITDEVLYKGKAIINTKDKTFQTGEKSYLKVQLPKGITPIFSLGGVKKVFQLPEGLVEHTFLLPQGKKKNDSFDYTLKLQTNEKLSFVPTSKMVYYTTEESGNGACEAALLYTSIKKEVTIPIDDPLLHPIQLTVANDTFTHTTTTHTTVLGNILTNDSYNTQSITTMSVTISTTTASANAPYIATSTGEVVLPANTSAGIYTLTYSLCAKVAPYNCSGLATVTVVVNPSPIQLTVANDTFTHTTTTHTTVLGNILTNDSYNTQSITTASVTISTTTVSAKAPYIATPIGEVVLPANTSAGIYTLTYSLCAKVAPYNCSGLATVTVVVNPSPIQLTVANDTFTHTTTIHTTVLGNILTNDSYNTQSITTVSVTISTTTASANAPYIATSTGEVVLPANTSAGIYTLTYSLCAKVAPYNCSGLATVTVVVNPSPIQLTVANDTFTHTTTTHTTVLGNILTNDSYNTQSITTASVTISTTTASANTPYIATSTGEVVLPANTSAGIYTLTYSLCAKVAPYNCSGLATVTVIVSKPLVIARDDTYTVTVGTTTITESIYHNDSIGEQTANTSLVNFQAIGGNKDRNNFYILSVNLAGNILIPQGTPTGTYTLQYRICDMNDIHNCATATITVVITEIPILPVVARDDTYTVTIGTTTITESIYHNDSIGDQMVDASLVNFQAIGGSKDSNNFYILSVSLAGNVLIPQATPIGTYTLEYRICDVHHRSNCDSATVRVSVIPPSAPPPTLVVTPDTFTYTGNTIVGNILDNDTINDNPIELPDDDINIEAEEPTDKEPYIDTATGDVLVPTHTPAGTYTLNYELCIENLTICDATTVEVIVPDVLTPTTPTPPIPPQSQDDNPATSLTPYNGISLNGDNKNDYFHIGGIEKYPENIVRIYNKNGLKVFEVTGYDNKNQSFKGFTQGEVTVKKSLELPIGTYFYFIEYTDENHQKQRKIGWLYLKK